MRLTIAHKLLTCGVAVTLPFALLFYCVVADIESRALLTTLTVLSLVLLALAVGLVVTTGRNLTRTLTRVHAATVELAGGRLRQAETLLMDQGERESIAAWQIPDEASELEGLLRNLVTGLHAPLKQIRRSSAEVTESSGQIAESLTRLEASVAGHAGSTNAATTASREILAATQELAETMRAVQQLASEAASLASTGLESLRGIDSTMRGQLDASDGISLGLSAISDRAAAITPVISTITNLANRANLVSLNAAIEAERAGEHALGFSVVALEIRRLADQTAVTALDLEKLIGELQAAVQEGVAGLSRYSAQTRNCFQTIAGITGSLSRPIDYIRRLEPHFEAANGGMQAQTRAARQVMEAAQRLAEVAGQTRDSLAGFRQNADQMRSAAQLLQGEVERFSAGA